VLNVEEDGIFVDPETLFSRKIEAVLRRKRKKDITAGSIGRNFRRVIGTKRGGKSVGKSRQIIESGSAVFPRRGNHRES